MGYHRPVLLQESIEGLNIRPGGMYVDLTFGGGGHSREVLKKLGTHGRLLAFDQDLEAEANVPDDERIIFIGANFRYLRNFLKYHAIDKVHGILADLGISSHQINSPERGFSFKSDQALDMRMDLRSETKASQVLNRYSQEALADVFRRYGEVQHAKAIAAAVVRARMEKPLTTTGDLEAAISKFIPRNHPSKFLARLYQSLRIEVNHELDALGEMLLQTAGCMAAGGRLVVITYHSLEDRMVKNYMRSGNLEGVIGKDFYGNEQTPWRLVNRNVITPSREETEQNRRARSAKLRIAERN